MTGGKKSLRLRDLIAAAVLALGFTANSAWAFSLGDHTRLTLQALEEFRGCFPDAVPFLDQAELVQSNLGEDLNPIKKGLFYSHYFHPHKRIDMRREDSMASVTLAARRIRMLKGLPDAVRPLVGDIAEEAGHMIHHLQDAASPPHVVPVDHGLSDGFESFDVDPPDYVRSLAGSPYYDLTCEELAKRAAVFGFEDVLSRTAEATLKTLRTRLELQVNGAVHVTTWEDAYWKQSEGPSFGRYGFLGNSFGQPLIQLRSRRVEVSRDALVDFKYRQQRLAIEATLLALYRVYLLD